MAISRNPYNDPFGMGSAGGLSGGYNAAAQSQMNDLHQRQLRELEQQHLASAEKQIRREQEKHEQFRLQQRRAAILLLT